MNVEYNQYKEFICKSNNSDVGIEDCESVSEYVSHDPQGACDNLGYELVGSVLEGLSYE